MVLPFGLEPRRHSASARVLRHVSRWQLSLASAWLTAREGTLTSWPQAKAWAVREVWGELHDTQRRRKSSARQLTRGNATVLGSLSAQAVRDNNPKEAMGGVRRQAKEFGGIAVGNSGGIRE